MLRRRRPWRWRDTLDAIVLALIVVAGIALVVAWDLKRGCLVWSTRYDPTGYSGFRALPVCVK